MAADTIKYPAPGSITFSDGDTDFIVTTDKATPSDAIIVTGQITISTFDDTGSSYETTIEVNFPRLGQGWGVSLADTLRNFFPRMDMSRAGQCFSQDCFIAIRDISFVFTDTSGQQLDSGGTGLYLAILIYDPLSHGYTDIYSRDHFLCLSSPVPAYIDGYFSFCYMQDVSAQTSAYLVDGDTETLLAAFSPDNYQLCFYSVAGRFSSDRARLEIRTSDGTVISSIDMARADSDSYHRHLLYLPSSLGTPELFVCTGTLERTPDLTTEVFELRRRSILTHAAVSRTLSLNTGYLSTAEYDRLSDLLHVEYECLLDGVVCLLTEVDGSFVEDSKNNITLNFRQKWN